MPLTVQVRRLTLKVLNVHVGVMQRKEQKHVVKMKSLIPIHVSANVKKHIRVVRSVVREQEIVWKRRQRKSVKCPVELLVVRLVVALNRFVVMKQRNYVV